MFETLMVVLLAAIALRILAKTGRPWISYPSAVCIAAFVAASASEAYSADASSTGSQKWITTWAATPAPRWLDEL